MVDIKNCLIKMNESENFDIFKEILGEELFKRSVPIISHLVLSCRQKKEERNILKAIDELYILIEKIKDRLRSNEENIELIKNKLFPIAFDFIIDEQEEDKIKYIVSGIEEAIETNITNEDLILTYYDILHQLRIIDISILLKIYNKSKDAQGDSEKEERDDIKFQSAETYILNKLENLSIITIAKTYGWLMGGEQKVAQDSVKITKLGMDIIEFFKIKK